MLGLVTKALPSSCASFLGCDSVFKLERWWLYCGHPAAFLAGEGFILLFKR